MLSAESALENQRERCMKSFISTAPFFLLKNRDILWELATSSICLVRSMQALICSTVSCLPAMPGTGLFLLALVGLVSKKQSSSMTKAPLTLNADVIPAGITHEVI